MIQMSQCTFTTSSIVLSIFKLFLAHLSRRLRGELIVYRSSRRPSVHACVRPSVRVHTFKHEYLRDQWVDRNQILSEASFGWGIGCIRFWARSDPNSGFHGNRKLPYGYNGENGVSTFSRLFFIRSFSYLQVTKSSDKFEFQPDWTTD